MKGDSTKRARNEFVIKPSAFAEKIFGSSHLYYSLEKRSFILYVQNKEESYDLLASGW